MLYPDQFADINPNEKADAIYSFLVGEPIFAKMNTNTGMLGHQKIDLVTL